MNMHALFFMRSSPQDMTVLLQISLDLQSEPGGICMLPMHKTHNSVGRHAQASVGLACRPKPGLLMLGY